MRHDAVFYESRIPERRHEFRVRCLDCDAQLVGGGQVRRPDEEEGTDP